MTHDHHGTHDNDHHDHSHTHINDDGHSHDHEHGHSHSHDPGHTHELTFEQKLEKLFGHWIDHNDSHKDTFFTWATRAEEAGLIEVAGHLEKAGELSQQVTQELKDSLDKLTN